MRDQVIKITQLFLPEDIKDTDTFTVVVEPSGKLPVPSTVSVKDIKDGVAKVRVDDTAERLILISADGECQGIANTVVTWNGIESTPTPTPTSTPTPVPNTSTPTPTVTSTPIPNTSTPTPTDTPTPTPTSTTAPPTDTPTPTPTATAVPCQFSLIVN